MDKVKESKVDIKSMNLNELKDFMVQIGEKPFRAKQIYEWLHIKHVESFDEMTNISKKLIESLKQKCKLVSLKKEEVQI